MPTREQNKIVSKNLKHDTQFNVVVNEGYLVLVDNCSGNSVPLLEFRTNGFKLNASGSNSMNKAIIDSLYMSTNFYNRYISLWEPLQSQWKFSTEIQYLPTSNNLSVFLSSRELLNLTVTSNLINTLDETVKKWMVIFNFLFFLIF